MFARRVAAASLAGALSLGLVAAPALGKPDDKGKPDDPGSKSAVKGSTSLMFTKSVKKKLAKDGISVTAVPPATKRNAVKFVFKPALRQTTPQEITHTGGLRFERTGGEPVVITDFVFNLENENGTVDVTVPGDPDPTQIEDALDLAKVKITKKTVKARVTVPKNTATFLNSTLKTSVFESGMFLAKTNSKF
jgi:hypothetical protein